MFGLTPYERKFYEPFFSDFEKDFNFPQAPNFKTDIRDNGDSYILEAELPGFKKEDITIDINGDNLTISAKHEETKEEKDSKGNYIRRERSFGSAARSFDISEIKSEDISAAYNNGILTLTLPKKSETAPANRRLEIK